MLLWYGPKGNGLQSQFICSASRIMASFKPRLSAKELVATSGAYSYGLARASKNMLCRSECYLSFPCSSCFTAGEYTVIVSAFEPHHNGAFSLTIGSSLPFDFKPIPQEGAGMYTKVLQGSWYVYIQKRAFKNPYLFVFKGEGNSSRRSILRSLLK